MLLCGNNLLQSHRPQTFHLLHLDVPHPQPFPPSFVTFLSHLSALLRITTPSLPHLSKAAKPKRNTSQSSLIAITRQFSSLAESIGLKLIYAPVRCCIPLQQLLSNLCRSHVNYRWVLNAHYSDRNLDSFPIHIDYETKLRPQLSKFNTTVRDNFDPSDPVNCKAQCAHKTFLHRICVVLQWFRILIHNTATHFFV